jgi:hypothetical protein
MKIGVSAIGLNIENTGIGNYTINLLNFLVKLSDDEIYLFTALDKDQLSNINPKIKIISINNKFQIKHFRPIAEQFLILKYIRKYEIDILFCPFYISPLLTRCKTVITVHDMIYKLKNDGGKLLGDIYRDIFYSLSILKAKKIITPELFTVIQ